MNNIQFRSTGETVQRAGSIQSKPCGKSAIVKLTDYQCTILSAAAARDDGALLPLSSSLIRNKGAITRVLRSLVRKGLAAETFASPDDTVWRLDDDAEPLTLVITDQGLAALGLKDRPVIRSVTDRDPTKPAENGSAHGPASSHTTRSKANAPSPNAHPKPSTKIGVVIELLRREESSTIADMIAATGWQAYSVRGAISGTIRKKLEYNVVSQAVEGRARVYRIATDRNNQ